MTPEQLDTVKRAREALENHPGNYKLSRAECVKHNAIESDLDKLIAEAEAQQAAEQTPYGWVRMNGVFNSGVFHLGATCPPGWVGAAEAVTLLVAPIQQAVQPVEWPHKWGCTAGLTGSET